MKNIRITSIIQRGTLIVTAEVTKHSYLFGDYTCLQTIKFDKNNRPINVSKEVALAITDAIYNTDAWVDMIHAKQLQHNP